MLINGKHILPIRKLNSSFWMTKEGRVTRVTYGISLPDALLAEAKLSPGQSLIAFAGKSDATVVLRRATDAEMARGVVSGAAVEGGEGAKEKGVPRKVVKKNAKKAAKKMAPKRSKTHAKKSRKRSEKSPKRAVKRSNAVKRSAKTNVRAKGRKSPIRPPKGVEKHDRAETVKSAENKGNSAKNPSTPAPVKRIPETKVRGVVKGIKK